VRLLLDAGARVNAADGQGYSALMYAAMADKLEIVQELLARGADVNAKDKKGFTVLEMAGGQRVRQILTQARDR
jgi:ankyrin repeat protein